MLKTKWLIGSDPEIFLERSDGSFINAHDGLVKLGCIKGTKAAPEIMSYGAIQVDGMAVELNTKPTDDPVAFRCMIEQGLQDACIRFGQANVSASCVQHFDLNWLRQQHPDAIELGCDPDFNAWEHGVPNPRPLVLTPYRTAGGHIHIGWLDKAPFDYSAHIDECCAVVCHMDYVLGVWSIQHDKAGAKRRELYGTAGAFRPKDYGVEYRVLSNFWALSPSLTEEVVRRTLAGMDAYADNLKLDTVFGSVARDILDGEFSHLSDVSFETEALLKPYMEARRAA